MTEKAADAIDAMIDAIKKSTVRQMVDGAGTPRLADLLDVACPLFEQFLVCDQTVALALMFGMACAAIEGEPVEIERYGVLVDFETRLRIFTETARVTFAEAFQARSNPDCPQLPGTKH